MSIHKKLMLIQSKLKAPKNQYNNFGNYKYRNLEDILEAVKPLLSDNNCTLTISDEIIIVGERIYVKAIATLTDIETGEAVVNTALARETENKKGMDHSQLTGATSSYARKYCLNGLFCIDDNKDADSMNNKDVTPQNFASKKIQKLNDNQVTELSQVISVKGIDFDAFINWANTQAPYDIKSLKDIQIKDYQMFKQVLDKK